MHVLVTGANGYIGLRLIQALLEADHEITAVIRDRQRFPGANFGENEARLHVVEADFLDAATLRNLPQAIDAAYYLIHSMGSGGDFARKEEQCAANFSGAAKAHEWKRIIYLGGLAADEGPLSEHLSSRRRKPELLTPPIRNPPGIRTPQGTADGVGLESRLRAAACGAPCAMIHHLLPIGAAVLLASCSSLPVPGRATAGAPTEAARQLMKQSAASHGDAWKKYSEVEVEYTGEWSAFATRLQPVLTDPGFRGSSVEVYQPAAGKIRQVHTGPLGTKTVDRRKPEIHVSFNGNVSSDREVLDSAALVADAYTAFLFGPSWLSRKGTDFKLIGERTLDGERCHLIAGRLTPGFGNSSEDHFIAWIGRDSSLMRRLQFTLNGLDSTRGADVDVTFSDYQKTADGSVWPRNSVEYIQRPLLAKAHQWRMKSLKLDGSHVKSWVSP